MSLSRGNGNGPVPELTRNSDILKEVPFFEGFPPEVIKLLAYLAVRGDYEQGDVLIERGDDPGIAFAIIEGEVAVYHGERGDGEPLRSYGEGAFLGGLSLLGSMPSLFTIKAVKTTRVLVIDRENFSTVADQHKELTPLIRKVVLKQLRRWEQTNIEELQECCLNKVGVTLL